MGTTESAGDCVCGCPLERVTADLYMCKHGHHSIACVICYAPTYLRNGKVTCETEFCSGNQLPR